MYLSGLLCRLLLAVMVLSGILSPHVDGCDFAQPVCGAYAPGDVILGIMLPCHQKAEGLDERIKPEGFLCSGFDLRSFMRALTTIHQIEEINASGFLPGVQLGYMLCDTCAHASKTLQDVGHMLAFNGSLNVTCNYTDFRPSVKIILGALYSEESIALARLLSVYMVPLLSSTSSSPELSDKLRYPVFLRTVPSDSHQTKALAKLMHQYNWDWIGVVYGDDEYGKAAYQSFLTDAEANNVCMAFSAVLPHNLDNSQTGEHIKQVVQQIQSTKAQVVLLILREQQVEVLFKEIIQANISRIWISSDAWSRSWPIAQMDDINKVGDILGFTFLAEKTESFDNYLKNLTVTPGGYNYFIEEYKNLRFNCSPECFSNNPPSHCPSPEVLKIKSDYACNNKDPQEQNDDFLLTAVDISEPYLNRVAVWAVANALKKLMKCDKASCSGEINFPPWKFLKEIKKVRFKYDNQIFYFDENGDFVNGYDLITWEKHGHHRRFKRIGRYHVLGEQVEIDAENLTWISTGNITRPQSRCSESCPVGWVKKILNVSCCYNCTECAEGTYTDTPDSNACRKCPNGTWSLKGWDHCQPRTESYLQWGNPHPIALMAATGFGILLLLVILIIFLVYRNSPPMKRAEVRLSCVMMAGLAVSFASVICYIGRPSTHLCRARQLMYAMGFTLCVSSILVKAFRTFLAFLPFGQMTNRRLHKCYKPVVIIIVITTFQGLICVLWMIFDSPDVMKPTPPPQSMKNLVICCEGETFIGFGIMLSYIALLAFFGFLLAFKGRKVPQEFSETGYIIFSMLMYLFVWMCFIPVYITNNKRGYPVQASAILISSYGIIFCHFIPKCYEALCGSKTDTLERILRRWRVVSGQNLDSETDLETYTDVPAITISSEKNGRFSISSTTTTLKSEVSLTDSEPVIIPTYEEKSPSYTLSKMLGTNVTRRRRSSI